MLLYWVRNQLWSLCMPGKIGKRVLFFCSWRVSLHSVQLSMYIHTDLQKLSFYFENLRVRNNFHGPRLLKKLGSVNTLFPLYSSSWVGAVDQHAENLSLVPKFCGFKSRFLPFEECPVTPPDTLYPFLYSLKNLQNTLWDPLRRFGCLPHQSRCHLGRDAPVVSPLWVLIWSWEEWFGIINSRKGEIGPEFSQTQWVLCIQ